MGSMTGRSHVLKIGCNLPDLCLAWLYVYKLRLDNGAELNLLSSTGNKYELPKLQDAAVIQDRMNRRLCVPRKNFEKEKVPTMRMSLKTLRVRRMYRGGHV